MATDPYTWLNRLITKYIGNRLWFSGGLFLTGLGFIVFPDKSIEGCRLLGTTAMVVGTGCFFAWRPIAAFFSKRTAAARNDG